MSVVYLVGGLIFFFLPKELFYFINVVPTVFHIGNPVSESSEYFWLALATSMMIMLSLISFLSYKTKSAETLKALMSVHALSKITSTLGFLLLALKGHVFAYWSGIITDFPLFLIVIWLITKVDVITETSKGSPEA